MGHMMRKMTLEEVVVMSSRWSCPLIAHNLSLNALLHHRSTTCKLGEHASVHSCVQVMSNYLVRSQVISLERYNEVRTVLHTLHLATGICETYSGNTCGLSHFQSQGLLALAMLPSISPKLNTNFLKNFHTVCRPWHTYTNMPASVVWDGPVRGTGGRFGQRARKTNSS